MIRVVFFLLAVGALALAAPGWLTAPATWSSLWQGLRIETSLMVLIGAILAAMAVLALIWTLLRAIFHFAIYLPAASAPSPWRARL